MNETEEVSSNRSPIWQQPFPDANLTCYGSQAINLMRAVLENPEPLKNLASLIKAQQAFFAQAAESLASIQGERLTEAS